MVNNFQNLVGYRFGNLTVICEAPKRLSGHSQWFCRCDCGNELIVSARNLKNGRVTHCEYKDRRIKHGCSQDVYAVRWYTMMSRCYNKNNKSYKNYGGRGIKVCDEWHDIVVYCKWCHDTNINNDQKLTVDRINNDGDYSPENCRWATSKEQNAKGRRRKCQGKLNIAKE